MQLNDNNGLMEPDHKDFLQYYLSHAKDESTYISNKDIAGMLEAAFSTEDLHAIVRLLAEEL